MGSIKRLLVLAIGLAGLLAMLTMGVVLAQGDQLGGKLRTGSEVTIPPGETVDHDVYVFGGTLVSNGTINGDLVVAGGNIDVNGPVKGDVLAAGGRISINGPVGGDVRTAGGQVTIAGDVAEDVLAAGGQVTLGGRVGQDVIVSSGQLTLTGAVAGSATGTVGAYTKSGTVAGSDSITVTGNQVALPTAPSNPVLDAIRQFIAVLLVAALALWLVPRALVDAEGELRRRPLLSFGWGIGAFIAFIVLVIVIAVVAALVGIVLGLLGFGTLLGLDLFAAFVVISGITLAFVVACAFLVDAIVGLALARLVVGRSGRSAFALDGSSAPRRDRWSDLALLLIGVAIVVALTALPLVGGWVKFVVVLFGLGGLWLAWRRPGLTPPAERPPESQPPAAATPG